MDWSHSAHLSHTHSAWPESTHSLRVLPFDLIDATRMRGGLIAPCHQNMAPARFPVHAISREGFPSILVPALDCKHTKQPGHAPVTYPRSAQFSGAQACSSPVRMARAASASWAPSWRLRHLIWQAMSGGGVAHNQQNKSCHTHAHTLTKRHHGVANTRFAVLRQKQRTLSLPAFEATRAVAFDGMVAPSRTRVGNDPPAAILLRRVELHLQQRQRSWARVRLPCWWAGMAPPCWLVGMNA
jgi:hypothetical protein